MSCIRRALQSASWRFAMQRYITKKRFVALRHCVSSLSETERCIATRQNKMEAPDEVGARFKKLNVFLVFLVFLDQSALCINDHKTQNQSLKQAPLAFYEKFSV